VALVDMAGHLIRRLNQASTQTFQRRMGEAGFELTSVQFAAMYTLQSNPGIEQAQIAALIAYDRATIGGVIDRLEQKGYVSRVVSQQDRRAREVSLTKKGEKFLESIFPLVESLQDEILVGLSASERNQFLKLARKVVLLKD